MGVSHTGTRTAVLYFSGQWVDLIRCIRVCYRGGGGAGAHAGKHAGESVVAAAHICAGESH